MDTSENIHVRSFRDFISRRLPEALAAVIPLMDYQADWTGEGKGRVTFCVGDNGVRLTFDDLPFPRPDGTFAHGSGRVVVMAADSNDLEQATIKAVGEQLMDAIGPRLVAPPAGTELDEAVLRAWFPLDKWLRDFILEGNATAQWLDDTNPIAAQTHLRRLLVTGPDVSFHPSQIGRACPFETPEGPNIGRPLTLALGADVRDGRIVPAEDEEGALGLSASLIPLLCHNHPTRQLMGVNMIRQMVPADKAEPPLVRSGLEPENTSAWLGSNFLTAFMHWKGMNYEDAIVMSESAAARLASSPWHLQVGDKLANRHGTKGVVGAILPDREMPHLPDGRPVGLIFDAMGLYGRLNFGQVIEAALGLIADRRGDPIIAPPFRRTTPAELHALLRDAGLPESGQFTLTNGKDGSPLDEPSTVGIVYWGKLVHIARIKIHAVGANLQQSGGQRAGRMEHLALRAAGARENILDTYSTRAIPRQGASDLLARVASGFLAEGAAPPSPAFRAVQRALRTAMIALTFDGTAVTVAWAEPDDRDVLLAEPLDHPWMPGRPLTHLGPRPAGHAVYDDVLAANERLAKTLAAGAPEAARQAARSALHRAAAELFDALLGRPLPWGSPVPPPDADSCAVGFGARCFFSGRAVLAPGFGLKLGEVGLPEDIAWPLFGALAADQIGPPHIDERGDRVKRAIERVMKDSIVIINRAPTWEPTNVTAFEPVMVPGNSILLHPLCCRLFNADFDGDQAAVHLPVTQAAQQEAKEKLTLAGHLTRDPAVVVGHLTPGHSILVGLAYALESPEGRAQFDAAWPDNCPAPSEPLTRQNFVAALLQVLDARGPDELLRLLENLYQLGITWATRSGASFSPFVGEGLHLPPVPASDAAPSWHAYASIVESAIMAQAESDPTLRAPVRAVRSGARGATAHLRAAIGPLGVADPYDPHAPIEQGYRDGLAAEDLWSLAARSRRDLQGIWESQAGLAEGRRLPDGASLLRRAMFAENPGELFAQAADANETDPLTDPDVRLWIGLLPLSGGE